MFRLPMVLFFRKVPMAAAFLLLLVVIFLQLGVGGWEWPFIGCIFYYMNGPVFSIIFMGNSFFLFFACRCASASSAYSKRVFLYAGFAVLSNYFVGCIDFFGQVNLFRMIIFVSAAQLIWPLLAMYALLVSIGRKKNAEALLEKMWIVCIPTYLAQAYFLALVDS